jgi:penicillin-binding protein 1B
VGGRNYRASQLNRANALRQPGSSFKPFVYAAAFETAIDGSDRVITPATMVVDEPTAFANGNDTYEPSNFHEAYHGRVSLRRALMKSMNVATVKVAEMVGLGRVVDLANRAGMNGRVKPTPALALGAYEVTPLQIASAYTIFSNQGIYEAPHVIKQALSYDGSVRYSNRDAGTRALDPRVAYLMVNLLEDVVRGGTAAGLAGQGIRAPVAAKTGTSRDGWFAGFTSTLLCVVWVGFDDGSELGLEGARSAMPVWAHFMKQALTLPEYSNALEFPMPRGVRRVWEDPTTGMIANEYCPEKRADVFIEGTQPRLCNHHDEYDFVIPTQTELPNVQLPWTVQ